MDSMIRFRITFKYLSTYHSRFTIHNLSTQDSIFLLHFSLFKNSSSVLVIVDCEQLILLEPGRHGPADGGPHVQARDHRQAHLRQPEPGGLGWLRAEGSIRDVSSESQCWGTGSHHAIVSRVATNGQ